MDESLEDVISRAVTAVVTADNVKVEAACEDALQGGKYGVAVLRNPEGRVLVAEVNNRVPYGEIYEVREPWRFRVGSWRA